MQEKSFQTLFRLHHDLSLLTEQDHILIRRAREAAIGAYAPYSGFRVGAAALMDDSSVVISSNQENASFPAGLCAERVLLSTISSVAPGKFILTMAIVCESDHVGTIEPVAPCGVCRQSMVEFEYRLNSPIRLLLVGSGNKVLEFKTVSDLLPFAFKPNNLGR
jgi:cytidine deaminase